jgi:hypothetical protein
MITCVPAHERQLLLTIRLKIIIIYYFLIIIQLFITLNPLSSTIEYFV